MSAMRQIGFRFIGVITFASCFVISCSKPTTPESKFGELFGDLSVGVPTYQAFSEFTQPEVAIKGNYCTVDFGQSQTQFVTFVARLGVSEANVLSSTGIWVRASSKTDPKYPWMLLVHAYSTNAPSMTYHVHIEGRQPYD